jgi:uncharacterized protein (DUF302 family)
MNFLYFSLLLMGSVLPVSATDNGLVNVPSKFSVPETLDRLESLVKEHGLTVFARIDFSGDAEKAGLKMKPSQLLIFGNPKAGTPLMIASPSIAIDLPLKALAWEDANGKMWLSYNKPEYLKERHGLPDELVKNISGVKDLVQKAVE